MAAKYTNRLIDEQSPYLLQHAHNPVDWYPWGDEAFRKAADENRPVFLSIGYSTCHWCHVMAHESFEDSGVADILNDVFVCVKVDREERPDVDALYMAAAMMLSGGGGWPLNILLTPDKKPFFSGTYFPRETRQGRIGVKELALRIADLWKESRPEIDALSSEVLDFLKKPPAASDSAMPGLSIATAGFRELSRTFDSTHGGFGGAPRFPTPHVLLFLLRYWRATGEEKALEMALRTITAMIDGGIHDHLGGGFHRYSTDREWLVPHFEKMLYDQAMLAMAFVEAYRISGTAAFRSAAEGILDYVLRDMTSPDGTFYAAEDADSEGREGAFYLWRWEELLSLLGPEDLDFFAGHYGVRDKGNFTTERGLPSTENIIHKRPHPEQNAGSERDSRDVERRLAFLRSKLFSARENRPRPHRDEKILIDWNGLMIAALAVAGRALGNPRYTLAAQRAADSLLGPSVNTAPCPLHHVGKGGRAVGGFLDDYGFFSWGLLELYFSSGEQSYLDGAVFFVEQAVERFWDSSRNVFAFAADDGDLPAGVYDITDGALPSGNSVMLINLMRLCRITGDTSYARRVEKLLKASSDRVARAPVSHGFFLAGILGRLDGGGGDELFTAPSALDEALDS